MSKTIANLNIVDEKIEGFSAIVVTKDLADIPCGVTLDVTNYDASVIKAGHVLKINTSTGVVSPLGITSDAYASLGESEAYYGINKTDIRKSQPFAAVLTIGQVNAAAAEKHVGAPYTSTIAAGLPRIEFINL